MPQVAFPNEYLFPVMGRLGNHAAERVAEKRAAPEFQSLARGAVAANVSELLSHAVHHSYKDSIGNRVTALDGAPRVMLHLAMFCFFVRMPADRSGIKKNVGALQCGQARPFRIPLVPAH